jgi:DNA glycosylase AlkZ-like
VVLRNGQTEIRYAVVATGTDAPTRVLNFHNMIATRYLRLQNQHLLTSPFKNPVDVVTSLAAIQAQDYYGAKWAIGQRMRHATDGVIEQAFADGRILRLHVMRPTWHFVAPDDIRWLVKLTAPRVKATHSYYFKKSELDDATIKRTNRILTKALLHGKQLTRDELRQEVKRAGVEPGDSERFGRIMFRAELDGVVCSGPRKGNQFTYALVDERVPASRLMERDEALMELSQRYFKTRGPASAQDFAWWSGLTLTDVKRAIDICGPVLKSEVLGDKTYWISDNTNRSRSKATGTSHLLSAYDEYFISYKDRSAAIHPQFDQKGIASKLVFDAPLVLDGFCVGGWKRVLAEDEVTIQMTSFVTLKRTDQQALKVAAQRYAKFLDKSARITLSGPPSQPTTGKSVD